LYYEEERQKNFPSKKEYKKDKEDSEEKDKGKEKDKEKDKEKEKEIKDKEDSKKDKHKKPKTVDKEKEKKKRARENEEGSPPRRSKKRRVDSASESSEETKLGFEHGDTAEAIVGARKQGSKIQLYVHWKDKNICSFVDAAICNQKIPQKVIEYYEERLRLEPEEKKRA